jgi:ribonuclease HII
MPEPKYIVAVSACGDAALAGPVVAVALIYPTGMAAPVFRFDTEDGKETIELDAFGRLPEGHRPAALEHLRTTAATFVPLLRPPSSLREVPDVGKDTLELMGLTGLRAMERFFHDREEMRVASRDDFHWYIHGTAPLPEVYVFGRQKLVVEASFMPWQVLAADLLAKDLRSCCMMQAAARYPAYRFDKHMGFPTKAHRAEIKKNGTCAEHWRE